jgi:flagellar basal-body rod protein FlgB
MEILKALFGDRADLYEQALGLAAQRHQALTANLANVNTPGYQRRDADFRIALEEAESASLQASAMRQSRVASEFSLRRANPRHLDLGAVTRSARSTAAKASVQTEGGEVNLEQEVTALAETQLQYDAVAMMARRYFQGLKSVIREGR